MKLFCLFRMALFVLRDTGYRINDPKFEVVFLIPYLVSSIPRLLSGISYLVSRIIFLSRSITNHGNLRQIIRQKATAGIT